LGREDPLGFSSGDRSDRVRRGRVRSAGAAGGAAACPVPL